MSNLKALIIVHDNYQKGNVFPLGAGYISAMLRNEHVEVETFSMDVFHFTNDDLTEKLKLNSYDMVLLGFMAPRFRRTVRSLCHTIRDNIGESAWLILGGHGPSAIPEYIIEETRADIVCIGEADQTIVDLVKCKRNEVLGSSLKFPLEDVLGIVYKVDGKIVSNHRRPRNIDLDSLPFPAWDLFPMQSYLENLKFAGMGVNDRAFPIISSRGCTNRCTFCFRLESGIRSRSVENVLEEMIALHEYYNVNYYYFADELAVFSKKRVLQLTEGIQQKLPNIHYRMDCRVTVFDEDIAKALKKSGCVFLNIGFESTSQEVLDQMHKKVTVEQNIGAAEIANKYGIGIGINVIWGMPGDNEKTLRENAEFIKKYNQYDQIRTIRPVTPYPGSSLYNLAISQNKLKGPQDFFDKFKNSDRYMVNFMGMPEDKIYELLLEVNTDLILDHFENINGDMNVAHQMIEDLSMLYSDEDYNYTGPRQLDDNSALRPKYKNYKLAR